MRNIHHRNVAELVQCIGSRSDHFTHELLNYLAQNTRWIRKLDCVKYLSHGIVSLRYPKLLLENICKKARGHENNFINEDGIPIIWVSFLYITNQGEHLVNFTYETRFQYTTK